MMKATGIAVVVVAMFVLSGCATPVPEKFLFDNTKPGFTQAQFNIGRLY